MLGGIFQKRKKIQELRAPTLQDIKKFREVYGRHAEARHVETPACFERSIYKAISCQKELHALDFRQEDVTDPQIIALAETLLEMPLVSSLDLRDNRITDDGAKALLEVLRLQIITAKTAPKTNPETKKLVPPPSVPEYTRYVTNVNLKGNEISANVLDDMAQYTEILKREDKRLEIRAALNQIDRIPGGGVDEEDFKAVVKLLTGTEPNKKEVKQLMSQSNVSGDNFQNSIALENVLLAKCSSSPTKKGACPPWESIVQVRHADIGHSSKGSRRPVSHPSGQQANPAIIQARPIDGESSIQNPSIPTTPVKSRPVQAAMTAMPPSPMTANSIATPISPLALSASSTFAGTTGSSSIIVGAVDGSSPPKKAEFRPPASPPPPLPLPQSMSPERRGSTSSLLSSPTKPKDSSDNTGDQMSLPVANTLSEGGSKSMTNTPTISTNSTEALVFARQDSAKLTKSVLVSPTPRDEYMVDFSSWQDDDPFDEDQDELLHSPVQKTSVDVTDEVESVKSQEFERSVSSRQSTVLSHWPGSAAGGSVSGHSSPANKSSRPCDTEPSSVSRDLSSLAHNDHSDSSLEYGRDGSKVRLTVTTNERHDVSDLEPAVDEEEEVIETTVLDVMKDGKPRNVAVMRHTEFKRGLTLQDFPSEVPYRNLVALILSENGLRELSLFKECRFPVTTVLDLSQNALTKLNDEQLSCFPKLQVLDLSCNRLKVISGLGKLFDMKALSLCNNELRSVINIEHLVHLQILRLRSNAIAAPSALRLLSLNNLLTHLDLDDNPLMETDDKQRRKVTVHLLNIIPTLKTLGSVPVASHMSKDKRKPVTIDAPMGKSLLEHDECPSLRSIWASNACDILQIVQDRDHPPQRSLYDDDDEYGNSGAGGCSPTRQKKPNREAQRQKDELRSKFVGYRSRVKAPPSPVKTKTSPFAFGPPIPPPQRKSPKKKVIHDPKLAQEQKCRASQLSAPKHPPVDTDQLKQEQRRKSRPTFDLNMSVAERLQLVREKSLRRTSTLAPHIEATAAHRNSGSHRGTHQVRRENDHVPALIMEIRDQRSPTRTSPAPHQSIVEFRVEPLPRDSPSRLVQTNNQHFHSAPSPMVHQHDAITTATPATGPTSERKSSSKESLFLQSLAVADFLSHAEEEISTALTALNVLLSMCERSPTDLNKLREYRNSLDALDILDEQESHALFEKARHHDDPQQALTCTDAFEKLRTLKICIKGLLKKLEAHAPESATIQSYCTELRTSELRHIIDSRPDDQGPVDESPLKSGGVPKALVVEPVEIQPILSLQPANVIQPAYENDAQATLEEVVQPTLEASAAKTLHSRLFAGRSDDANDSISADSTNHHLPESTPTPREYDDGEFDFLSSDTSMFGDDEAIDTSSKREEARTEEFNERTAVEDEELLNAEVMFEESAFEVDEKVLDESISTPPTAVAGKNERSLSATSTDITQDLQHIGVENDDDFDFDSEHPLEDVAPSPTSAQTSDIIEADTVPSSTELDDEIADEQEIDWDAQETTEEDEEEQEEHLEPNAEEADIEADPVEHDESEFDLPDADAAVDGNIIADDDAELEEQQDEQEEAAEAGDEDDEEAETFGDWEKGFDPGTNHYFWFNHETGESQWVPPEGWPYEVDTPFEEDAQVEEEENELALEDDNGEGYDETPDVPDEPESAQSDSPPKSSFEADDDDVFSDQDLPDF